MDNFDISQLPPEVLAELIALGTIGDEQDELSRQMEAAQALKNQGGPRGIHTGRTYVAASPLSHIARGVESYKAGQELKDLKQQRQDLFGQQRAGRERFIDLLRGPKTPSQPVGPPSPSPHRGEDYGPFELPTAPVNEAIQRSPQPPVPQPTPNIPRIDIGDPSGTGDPRAGSVTIQDIPGSGFLPHEALAIAKRLRGY